jgi:outer membrane protein OmpA-like peptidoglycan-associated protein
MNRLFVILLMMVTVVSSGCVATRKFTRNEVKTSSDALSARIDTNSSEIKETRDAVDAVNQRVSGVDQKVNGVDQKVTTVDGRVTTVDGRVTGLDTKTTQGLTSLKSDVTAVDTKTGQAMNQISSLDEKFQSRNNFGVAMEHSVPFKFDSAKLDKDSTARLDEIASTLMGDKNAIVVLEGHTDSTGDRDYNLRLGERRVDAVRQYLAEKNVPIYKIHQISFGAARPIAENKSREGREKNRAVTVTIMTPSGDKTSARLQE